MGVTGGGATIAMTGKSAVAAGKLVSLSGITISGVAVEDADLSSAINKMIAGDLVTYSPVDATFVFNSTLGLDASLDLYDEAAVTIVITGDEDSAVTTTTFTATCFITSISDPEYVNNQRCEMSVTFQPKGEWVIT